MMEKWIGLTSLVALALTSSAQAAPKDEAYLKTAQQAYQGYILPSFQALNAEATTMEKAVTAFCKSPSSEGHEKVRKEFGNLVNAWTGVEFLRFGPMQSKNRFERLLFWPDRKGTALKKVRRAIVAQDPKRLEKGALVKSSVAFQGLNALEYALFGAESETLLKKDNAQGLYRCHLAHAISENIINTSSDLVEAWGPDKFGKVFTNPGPKNAAYQTPKEVIAELVKAIGTNAQYFTDVKLLPVMGPSAKKSKPKKAMFRRSGASIISMTASLTHARNMIAKSNFKQLLDDEAWWILNSADFELKNGLKTLDKIEKIGLTKAVQSEKDRNQLKYLETTVRGFGDVMIADFAAGAELVIGFNSLDGD